jgi:hypothetical protein
MYNESFQATEGMAPDVMPPVVPVYTGHFHIPHTVEGTNITYIGACGCIRLAFL